MPLRLSLKPHEKLFIGGAVIQNGDNHAEIAILNDVPILREKDIMTESEADSVCRRIYLCVQLMYMDAANIASYQSSYRKFIDEVCAAAPSAESFIVEINRDLASGKYYQALKGARKLVEYEQELIHNVAKSS